MSLPGKKGRDASQLPTLSYELKLNLPVNVDSDPQAISFLDLVANDSKFANDKEGLEFVLSSYVKACGKQSVTEILAERDTIVQDNASLSDIIRALMDYNDQQNANLGAGYTDPDGDDSFIDDSTAAQDILPKNMTNERDGFYVNKKRQPITAKYLSEPSESESDDNEESDDDDDDSEESEDGEEKSNKKVNHDGDDSNEKNAKRSRTDDDLTEKVPNVKRKRSISEVGAPVLPINLSEKDKAMEESTKKMKKISETSGDSNPPHLIAFVLPNEMEQDIKPSIEKLVKLILLDQTITSSLKKVERLFDANVCRELLDLVKKLHRHTNANRQLVFDILGSKIGLCTSILITRARLLLLNDYEPSMMSLSLNELKERLKIEINRSLEMHIQAHNQAIKEWQQKMNENPSKEKNRGPRKNFRLYKTINELIIRCIDRRLETLTIIDNESLELFLHDHIVSLWGQSGWMTAKKIIAEVIRVEYRPIQNTNSAPNPLSIQAAARVIQSPSSAERMKKETPVIPQTSPKILNPVPSPVMNTPKAPAQQATKANDLKPPNPSSINTNPAKPLEMATRVATPTTVKQATPRPTSNESTTNNQSVGQSSTKTNKPDVIRPIAKPATATPSSHSDSSTKRNSTPNASSISSVLIDFPIELFAQYKKQSNDSVKANTQTTPKHDLPAAATQRPASSSSSSTTPSANPSKSQQQFATKMLPEKSPAGSFLKEALIGSATPTKIVALPLAVDNMISKSHSTPKSNTNSSTMKPPATTPSPTNNTQRSSSSTKSSTNRPSTDLTHHRLDQQIQQPKPSSSSNRPSSNSSSSVSPVPSSRRPTTGYSSSHESQSNRGHSSQMSLPSALAQSLPWDQATFQLAAALANPQLLNSSIFDPALLSSVFSAANMTAPNPSPSSSRTQQQQQHSQNTNNTRRT